MRVLVTGGAGYIGSVLVRELVKQGYSVTVLDLMLFGDRSIADISGEKGVRVVKADVRNYDPELLSGHDAIVDLAAISQPDPLRKVDERLFYEVNYLAPVRTSKLATKKGVKRYIFASTCSVYGFQDKIVDEASTPNPLEAYAKTKYMAEQEIAKVSGLCKTVLRLATVYGYSPKIRFDLVVNAMTLTLYKYGKIRVGRPGTQKRPVVHVKDVADAILRVLQAPEDLVSGEVFNIGCNEQNYSILDIAYTIFSALNREPVIEFYGDPDTRSYVVDFSKVKRALGFTCKHTVADGAREVYRALEEGAVSDEPWTRVIDWWYELSSKGVIKTIGVEVAEQ